MNETEILLDPASRRTNGQHGIGPLELLVLQGTPFCNLNCSYCYLPDRDNQTKMELAVVEKAVERVLEANIVEKEFTVVWHAGEPLVLGVDYYDRAIARIADIVPREIQVNHSIQSNGVLIDKNWCDFFKRHKIRLGLSVDGPAKVHDIYRKTRNGKGTHAKLSGKLDLLKDQQVPFHVIAVLTDESIQYPDDLFAYFSELGIGYLCFNIEEIEGCNLSSNLLERNRYERYSTFLTRFHEQRFRLQPELRIREIDGAISSVMSWRDNQNPERLKPQENTPFKILNVDVNGNFSTFSPELLGTTHERYGDFRLGNLFSTAIADCLRDPHYQGIANAVLQGVQNCQHECDYFDLCGGGSPSNKLAENNCLDSTETAYCRLQRKACIDTALNILEKDLGIRTKA